MKKKSFKTVALACALVGVLGVAGISAYFTATDTAKNTFDIPELKVDLQEPEWDRLTPEDKIVTPNEVVTKDPKVVNNGDVDEYVFLSVKVPYKDIVTANDDGTRNTSAETQLFTWTTNAGWVQVGQPTKANGVMEYIYAWGTANAMTALAKDAETGTLFDTVKFCNAVEGQGLENTSVDIDVAVYAIQTTNLNNGVTAPADVLSVYQNQNPAN